MIVSRTPEGMTYAVRTCGNAVGNCAVSTRVGTRDEAGFHGGIAHFTEHCLFKGTSHKSAFTINNSIEKLGGELNAFTTKEEIVLTATVLKEDVARAASMLLEIALDARFPDGEVETEKGVVADEIAAAKDSPAEDIYDVFEEKLFRGTDLAAPILGSVESVQAVTPGELRRFHRRFFRPGAMVFTMAAPLPEKLMAGIVERCIRSALKKYLPAAVPADGASSGIDPCCLPSLARRQSVAAAELPFNEAIDKGNNEVNCVMGGRVRNFGAREDRLAAILLCNILAGPASNSILGSLLRERHGWVYNVECGYTGYRDAGVAAIQFGCDRKNLSPCRRLIRRELHKLQEHPLGESRLNAAKRQLLGQNAIGMESGEAQCASMGKSLLTFGEILSDEDIAARLMSVSSARVQELAREIFGDDNLSELVYL